MFNGQVEAFKAVVVVAAEKYGLDEKNWSQPSWKLTWKLIDQNVLDDAHTKMAQVREIFSSLGAIESRPKSKLLSRVERKQVDGKYPNNFFRPISDLLAIRLNCQLSEIENKIIKIFTIVSSRGGWCYVRGQNDEHPLGSYKEKGSYKKVEQYVYVFFKHIGYPIEIQLNHVFASYAFTVDTEKREKSHEVIYDTDWGKTVKSYILAKANNLAIDKEKKDIWRQVKLAHPGGIPPALNDIIDRL